MLFNVDGEKFGFSLLLWEGFDVLLKLDGDKFGFSLLSLEGTEEFSISVVVVDNRCM